MPGVLQITFHTATHTNAGLNSQSNQNNNNNNNKQKRRQRRHPTQQDLPRCWSLPAVIIPESTSNEFQHPIVLQERVARALGLLEGDFVAFQLSDYNSGTVMMMADMEPCFQHDWLNHNRDHKHDSSGLLKLQVSIDPSASFDVAIEANSERTSHIFAGTRHTPMGNFLVCTAAATNTRRQQPTLLKLNEQSIFGSLGPATAAATKRDLKCSGMLVQVEGLVDSFDGAGCGYCIYASSPLSRPKPSDLMVQGYRYLGANNSSSSSNNKENTTPTKHASIIDMQEATYFGLLEALQWVNRLDFQIVWVVGSNRQVFRRVLSAPSSSQSSDATGKARPSTLLRYLHKQVVDLLEQARKRRIQFKFLASDETGGAIDLATRAIVQRQNETWCHWATINYQCQRPLPFSKSLARQVSI